MRVPLSWLRDYVELTLPIHELAERLTLAGLAVDAIHQVGDWWDGETILVGEVIAIHPHPDADRLTLVDVDFGGAEPDRVVTGAPNIFAHKGKSKAAGTLQTFKVAFARSGATLVDAYSDERPRPMKKLKPSKIRGVLSSGMVCSERELGLSEEHDGILVLPDDAPVGTALRTYLGDQIFELDLTVDMARCLSITGVAREVAALTGATLHLPSTAVQTDGVGQAQDRVAVVIDAPELCNRYTGLLIENVTIGPSPQWMQQRLIKAGMRPINNVVDITNYVMIELGQPLHAFDFDTLTARQQRLYPQAEKPVIIVKRAGRDEAFTTLDTQARTLDENILMICDGAGSVAVAGVMGGLESEVTEVTRTVLLESATFDPINIRKTANKLVLHSEASRRFTRGVPANLNPIAAQRAAELMRLYAGGSVLPGIVDTYPVPQTNPVVYTTLSDIQRIVSLPETLAEVSDALRRLDFEVEQIAELPANAALEASFALHRTPGEPLLACTPPWYRLDVRIPADLAEEVARVIGYEHIGATLIADVMPTQRRNNLLETEEKVRDLLTAAGLQETVNYTLSNPENHAKLLASGGVPVGENAYVTLANPIAPERRVMRRSMVVSALENLERNLRFDSRHTSFELGRVYLLERGVADEQGTILPEEERHVTIALAGPRQPASFYRNSQPEEFDFFDIKGVVESLLARLGIDGRNVEYRAAPDSPSFGPRCAALYVEGSYAGLLGELHPKVRAAFDLPAVRICIADLLVQPLVRPHWRLQPMRPISSYMPVIEDLAFEVSEEITVRRVQELISKAGGNLLVNIELFDVYRGDNLPAGHKSLAFRLTYQSTERALAEKEVTKLRNYIIATVEKETSGKLRV